jgi:hypothetical protein
MRMAIQANPMGKTKTKRSWLLGSSFLGLALLAITFWRGQAGLPLLLLAAAGMATGELACRFLARSPFPPYLFMILSPVLLLNYSSIADFRVRLAILIMLAYILSLARSRPAWRGRMPLARIASRQAWQVSLLALVVAAAILHARGIQLSGDEPHYVMIAQSIMEDGDLDLKNNLQDKTYLSYLPVEIRFHGAIHGGRHRSFHMPGLAFLLLPFVRLFRLVEGAVPASLYFRLVAALFNSFYALGLFLVLQRALPEKRGQRLFLFFLMTFPLVFHAVHLFPELPAATLMIFAYLLGRDRGWFFTAGLLLAAIPWLHLKYGLPALILALFLLTRIWRGEAGIARRLKPTALFLAPLAAGLALLGIYSRVLYGSFNPAVISPEKNFLAIPFHFRIETLLSFFLDQRDGLLVYAPVALLAFLACKKEVRSQVRDFPLLAAISVSYVVFHAFTTVRGGYSPAARPTVFVLWIMAVFLAAWHDRARPGIERGGFRLLAGLTVFATAWLFYYPLFLYQPVTREVSQRASSLLLFWGSAAMPLSDFFPSFLKIDNAGHAANWAWLLLLGLAAGLYWKRAWAAWVTRAARLLFPFAGTALLLVFCLFPHVQLQTRYSDGGISFFCNSRNFSQRRDLGGFKFLAGQNYDLFIDLKGSAADRVTLSLQNDGHAALTVRNGRRTLLAAGRGRESQLELFLPAARKFRLGRRNLVHVGLETTAARDGLFFLLRFP